MDEKVVHDPLDPLEQAYESAMEEGESGGESGGGGDSEVFHGEPVAAGDESAGADSDSENPPPPPQTSSFGRILGVLPFAGAFLVIVLLAYGGYKWFTSRSKTKPCELTYWVLWEEKEVIQPLVDEYQKKHAGITINFERQTPIEYRERLQTRIDQGKGPDIFRYHNTWTPMLREELSALPEDVLSAEDFKERYYSVMEEDLSLDGKFVGLPLMYDGLMVFYNEDILKAGGFEAPADSWEAFYEQALDLTVKNQQGNIVTAGAAVGRADNIEHFSDILALLMLQNGANPAKPNTETGAGALVFYRLFAQEPANVWSGDFDNDIIAFAGGKTAMILAPSWEVFTIKAINPELNFKTAPVPKVKGADEERAWASYWVEGVNSKSACQKQAWQFLSFLSSKESLEKLFTASSNQRTFGEPYARKDMADLLSDNDYLASLIKQADTAKSFYMASRTFDNGINDRIIGYYADAVNSLDEGNSPEAALETAQSGIEEVLSTYNVRIEE